MWRRIRPFVLWGTLAVIAVASFGTATWMIVNANSSEVAYKQSAKNSAQADADRSYVDKVRSCGQLALPARAKCETEIYYSARQTEHDDRDLEAQRTTALWTRYLGVAGIVGTAFGLLGVALVLLTFMEQRRTSRAELRAYVDLSKVAIDDSENPSVDIHYTNFGQTPATNVMMWIDFLLRTWPIIDEPVAITLRKEAGTIPPGHPRRFRYYFVKAEWDAMIANTASFVIPIRIAFDFLGSTGSDEFSTCVVITRDEVKRGEGRYLHGPDRVPRVQPKAEG